MGKEYSSVSLLICKSTVTLDFVIIKLLSTTINFKSLFLSVILCPCGSDKVQRCLSHSTSGSGATISGCLSTWRGRTLRTRREGSTPKHRISTSPSPVPLCFYSSAIYLKGTTRMLLLSITVLYTFVLFKQTDTTLVVLVSFIFASVLQTLLSDVLMHLQRLSCHRWG